MQLSEKMFSTIIVNDAISIYRLLHRLTFTTIISTMIVYDFHNHHYTTTNITTLINSNASVTMTTINTICPGFTFRIKYYYKIFAIVMSTKRMQ